MELKSKSVEIRRLELRSKSEIFVSQGLIFAIRIRFAEFISLGLELRRREFIISR